MGRPKIVVLGAGLGGTIACDSLVGQGTRFVIEFPRHTAATEGRQE